MSDSIPIEALDDRTPNDFRRANGAPLVSRIDENGNPIEEGKTWRYSRPSGYAKPLDDQEALTQWKIDVACKGVADSPSIQAEWLAVDITNEFKPDRKRLREKAIERGRGTESADIGTALHAMTHRIERPDDDFLAPEPYVESIEAYLEALEEFGLTSEMIEFHTVNDEYRTAGTADRLYLLTKDIDIFDLDGNYLETLKAGTRVIGDLKTGAKLDFSLRGYVVQMALYAQGVLYDVDTNRRLDTPEINQSYALLVHMPAADPGKVELIWTSIEVGNKGAWVASLVKEWKRMKESEFCFVGQPSEATIEAAVEAIEEAFPGTVEVDLTEWVASMTDFIQARIKTIGGNDAARAELLRRWPSDLPTLKQGIENPEDVTRLLDLLDLVEANHGLPFPSGDPRAVPGVHSSELNRSNQPPTNQGTTQP